MARRYIVTALGQDGKVIVQATHDTPTGAVSALSELFDNRLSEALKNPVAVHALLMLWLTGEDTFELLSSDYRATCSITIIDE